MKRCEFLKQAVVAGGGVLFWLPRGFGHEVAGLHHVPWLMPHVRPWPGPRPWPPPWSGEPVNVERIDAEVEIADQVASTCLVIEFRNPGPALREGQVVLPVPAGAMLREFTLEGAGTAVTAQLLPKDEARRIYDEIVGRLKDPALLEFAGTGAVRSSVFPVPPGGAARLRMRYEEVLENDEGRIDYVLPRSESPEVKVPWTIRLRWHSKDGLAGVFSPSHEIEKERMAGGGWSARVTDASTPGSFRLTATPPAAGGGVAASLLSHADPRGDGGWFLLLLTPPARAAAKSKRREVTLVMDRSGSMAGEKIEQARQAALQVLEGLEDGERFNLIVYHEAVEQFAPQPVEVTRDSIRQARGFLGRVRVSGGTNIHGALKAAVGQAAAPGFVPIVLFLTDGLPTVGETSETRIRAEIAGWNAARRRIFTFGVGTDVNTPLLSRLAEDSRATASFVLPREAVELKVAAVFRRLAGPVLERPVLSTLRRDGGVAPGRTSDLIPAQLPDLFESDQLTLAGRYSGKGALRFRLEGQGDGGARTFSFEFRPGRGPQPFVPRLWATRKIAVLTDALRDLGSTGAPPDPNDPRVKELVSEIIRLSTEHGVLSDYTAFLARDGMVFQPAARQQSAAGHALYSRAVQERSGAGAVSQETNLWRQKGAERVDPSNRHLNARLVEERVEGVQQVADKAFYRRGDEWVDAVVIQQGEPADSRTVDIGSKEFHAVVDQLVAEGRQSCLALGPGLRVQAGGRNYLVR